MNWIWGIFGTVVLVTLKVVRYTRAYRRHRREDRERFYGDIERYGTHPQFMNRPRESGYR